MLSVFRRRILFGATLLVWSGAVQPAAACACCTEVGQRLERTDMISSGQRAELESLRFAATAKLYEDASFPDGVKGVTSPQVGAYKVRARWIRNVLVVEMTDPKMQVGRIEFRLPPRLTRFEVDPRDDAGKGLGPPLYKEWRLDGVAGLAGIFAAGGKRAQMRLILHGRGNSCTTSDHFTHWTLSMAGPGTRFIFLGDFAS